MGPLPFDRPVPRLLHTADWQIGKPYRWIEDLDRRSRLQRARLDAIERMVAVAASGAPSMELSWRAGKSVETQTVDTIADGLAVRVPIMSAVELMGATTDDVLLVSDEAMQRAMKLLFEYAGLVVEPSGAIGLGAMLETPARFRGKTVATILCGGNVTAEQARAWLF